MSAYRPSTPSPFGPERNSGGRDTLLFLGSLVVSIGYLLGPVSWGQATASLVRGSALVPFIWLQERAEEAKGSRARFLAVEAQRDSAAWAAQALPALRAENDRLRSLLGLRARLRPPFHPAEVLRQTQLTDGRTLVLSSGSEDGISEFDPVIAPEGLVGMILNVDARTSIAMTWAHPDFRASAVTEDGSVLGVISATQTGSGTQVMLELRGVPYSDTVSVGTLVLTAGLGGIFPRGVPIGQVIGVAREQPGWERIYLVRPAANLGAVPHVLVLSGMADAARAAAFIPPPAPEVAPVTTPAAVDTTARPPRRRRPRPVTDSSAPAATPAVRESTP